MFQRRPRRFRRRSNGRNYQGRGNGVERTGIGVNPLASIRGRNNFKPQQSAEKLAEKYKNLAKEALSSGDKTLSESYFQHADHYMRIINERNIVQNQNKAEANNNLSMEDKRNVKDDKSKQDKPTQDKE